MNGCLSFSQPGVEDCALCGAGATRAGLCDACYCGLPRLDLSEGCPICAIPGTCGEICGRCLKHPPSFTHTRAAFAYAFPADALIRELKYRANFALTRIFANALLGQIDRAPDAIVPMPLHRDRLRERGFNQSLEIAKRLGKALGIPVRPHAVIRTRSTERQVGLKLRARIRNVRGAFSVNEDVSDRRIAVLDDVMTSGATMDACCGALAKAGAEVEAWIVARAID